MVLPTIILEAVNTSALLERDLQCCAVKQRKYEPQKAFKLSNLNPNVKSGYF